MKARFCSRLFLPGILLLLVLLLACQQSGATPTPQPASPLASAAQVSKPLTAGEREAIANFSNRYAALQLDWGDLRLDFDAWRAGLTECHPSAAQESLRDFAASFKIITEAARNLPRTTSAKELADLIIPAVETEETAFRTLRDRWQPGNASFFEAVEQRRTEAAGARKALADRSLELQEEFEEGPTADEVAEAEWFSEVFADIEDTWEEYHDDYRQLRNREEKQEIDMVISDYNALSEQLAAVVDSVATLESTEIIEDLIETLQDAVDDEYDALTELTAALEEGIADPAPPSAGMVEQEVAPAAMARRPPPAAAPAQAAGEGAGQAPPEGEGSGQAPGTGAGPGQVPGASQAAVPANLPPTTSTMQGNGSETGSIFHDELDDAYQASIVALEEVSQGIEGIVEDKSAEYLVDVMDFDRAYESLLTAWESFHEDYDTWRETDGGCDRVSTLADLDDFSASATALAARVRDLPRNGYLLPVYTLLVDAGEQEASSMRALYNSWRPFAIDAFAAVDQERTSTDRLRQKAITSLGELTARP